MVGILRNLLAIVGALGLLAWLFGVSIPHETYVESRVDCVESETAGFHPSTGDYKPAKFTERSFALHIRKGDANNSRMTLIEKDWQVDLICRDVPGGFNGLTCTSPVENINLNMQTNRFTRSGGFGYAFSSNSSVSISMGTCRVA